MFDELLEVIVLPNGIGVLVALYDGIAHLTAPFPLKALSLPSAHIVSRGGPFAVQSSAPIELDEDQSAILARSQQ